MQDTQETRVWSLAGKDSPEEEMATHSSVLTWEVPWREEPGGLQSMGSQRLGHDWEAECTRARARAHTHTHTHTVMCLPIFFIFQMVSWCSVCALQKKGTRSGCYLCNWYWQQLRNRTDRTCGNHHNFATVSAIRTQAPQTWQWDWSVSGCNDDKVYLTITNFILADVLL